MEASELKQLDPDKLKAAFARQDFEDMRNQLLLEFKFVDNDELDYPFFFHLDEAKYIFQLILADIRRDEK